MSTSPQTSEKKRAPRKRAAAKTLADSKSALNAMGLPEPEMMALDSVLPYWRNPRRINDDAVNAVAASITEYGYSQPIVVDEGNVIIIGHTRYAAMRRLGVVQAPVVKVTTLTPNQVKELRILDNRSGEFTSWHFESLTAELEGLNLSLMRAFFPEVSSIRDDGPLAGEEGEAAQAAPDTSAWDEVDDIAEFICPSCFHSWEMRITPEAVKTGKLEVVS